MANYQRYAAIGGFMGGGANVAIALTSLATLVVSIM